LQGRNHREVARRVEDSGIEAIEIRSVLTCESKRGVCVKCYGQKFSNWLYYQKGDAVGIIAAQSIGEPGPDTQLTCVLSMWVCGWVRICLNLH